MPGWLPEVADPEARPQREWHSNAEILEAWKREHLADRPRNTRDKYPSYVAFFVEVLEAKWPGRLVTQVDDRHVQAVVDAITTKCAHLLRTRRPQCMAKLDLATCPALHGGDLASCPRYKGLDPNSVKSYLTTVGNLFRWLRREGYMATNPMEPVAQRFFQRHKADLHRRRRSPRRRALTEDEVRLLITRTPIHIGVVVALCSLGFMRIHEAMKQSMDARHLDLEAGWMRVTDDSAYGDKRIGNDIVPITPSLREVLRRYLVWRDGKVRRKPDGSEATDKLVLNTFGTPWVPNGFATNFNRQLHQHAIRLGIMESRDQVREERVNSHCFRAFATTWATDRGASELQVQVLRGDKLGSGSVGDYWNYQAKLPELARRFAPDLRLW